MGDLDPDRVWMVAQEAQWRGRVEFWRSQCELREKALKEREGQLEAAEKHVKIARAATLDERRARLELEREYATSVIAINPYLPSGFIAAKITNRTVLSLLVAGLGHAIGTCDRCGKRAPLHTVNPGLHEKDVCSWGCEVEP